MAVSKFTCLWFSCVVVGAFLGVLRSSSGLWAASGDLLIFFVRPTAGIDPQNGLIVKALTSLPKSAPTVSSIPSSRVGSPSQCMGVRWPNSAQSGSLLERVRRSSDQIRGRPRLAFARSNLGGSRLAQPLGRSSVEAAPQVWTRTNLGQSRAKLGRCRLNSGQIRAERPEPG